jgi:hypothetical protein
MTRYPFHGNGFITSNHYEVFLPFRAAANSEDSTQFSSACCSVLIQQLPALETASYNQFAPTQHSLFTAPLLISGVPRVVTRLSGNVFYLAVA